jgi:electron transfer flavoprotein beta subunit
VKIATIIKQVPDAEARIRTSDGKVDLTDVTFVLDGMDEYGTEQALRIREGGTEAEIIALALGPARFEEALRTALAMGADRAILVETDQDLDPVTQGQLLARIIREEGIGLVFTGGKEADWDSAALGPALAEALDWPLSDWTTSLELAGDSASTVHDAADGSEKLSLPLPAVITTQQGLNEPRYPTLPNIMKARRKELKVIALADLGGATSKTTILGQTIETRARHNVIIGGDAAAAASELVRRLQEEAKVLP